jgi:hypothetical protein
MLLFARKSTAHPPQAGLRWMFAFILAALFLAGCNTKKIKEIDGYRGKALADPFLGLGRLCEENFITFEQVFTYAAMKEPGTLFVASAEVDVPELKMLLNEARQEHGHLVICLQGTRPFVKDHSSSFFNLFYERVDHKEILDMLQLRLTDDNSPTAKSSASSFNKLNYQSFPDVPAAAYSLGNQPTQLLNAQNVPRRLLVWSAGKDLKSTPAVTVRHGEAKVTVLCSAEAFRNKNLGENDHAAFFLDFAATAGCDSIAYFAGQRKTLLALLMEHYGKTLFAVLALLGLWLWHKVPRFGPLMLANPAKQTARFTDHLKLSGNFLWRRGQSGWLLHGLRKAILNEVRLNHPQWRGCDEADLVPKIAQFSKITLEEMDAAWNSLYEPDPAKFTQFTKTLQNVLSLLKSGPSS